MAAAVVFFNTAGLLKGAFIVCAAWDMRLGLMSGRRGSVSPWATTSGSPDCSKVAGDASDEVKTKAQMATKLMALRNMPVEEKKNPNSG